MTALIKVFKEEIARTAKREANKLVLPQAKTIRELRRNVSELKKRIAVLEKFQNRINPEIARAHTHATSEASINADTGKGLTGRGIRAIRKRLGLTQIQFAELVGVGELRVPKWEIRKGRIALKPANMARITEIGNMRKQQALKQLGLDKAAAAASSKPAVRSRVEPSGFSGRDMLSLRNRLNLSQTMMAKKLGVSQKCISLWESKKQKQLAMQPDKARVLKELAK